MKKLGFLLVSMLLATAGWGQAVFNKFGPANGVQKNTGTTYQNTAAVAADIYGLWSGTCSASTFLRGDGSCAAPAGGVTGLANPTGTIGLTAVNGSATTAMRSDASPPLSQAITPTWTGIHTFANAVQTVFNNSLAGADAKNSIWRMNSSGQMVLQSATDAAPTTSVTNAVTYSRTGAAWTGLAWGNATDNPTFTFSGTGQMNISGGVVAGGATGGNKGAGTINAVGLYVGGVAVGTGGGSPGGSTGQLQYNNGGVFAGVGGSTFTAATQQLELIPSAGNITALKATSNGTNDVEIVASNAAGADAYFRAVDLSGVNWSIGNQRSTNNFVLANGVGLGSNPEMTVSTSGVFNFGGVPTLNVNGTTAGWSYGGAGAGSAFSLLTRYNAASGGSDTMFYHSRGAAIGTNTILQNNDETGSISFMGSDGTTTPVRTARIISLLDGAPSAGTSYPGRLEFYTVPSGSTSIALAMKLDSTQTMTVTAGINAGGSIGTVKNSVGGGIQLSAQNTDATSNGTFSQVLAANSSHSFHHLITGTAQSTAFITGGFTGEGAYLYTDSGVPLCIGASGACRATVSTAGSWSILTPSSTTAPALGISAAAGQYGEIITAPNTTGQSVGMRIFAGTNASDFTFVATNAAQTVNYLTVWGDGGTTIGTPTGGDKGSGTINAQAVYVNGTPVSAGASKFVSGVMTIGTSSCTVAQNTAGISGCTFNSTGNVTVTFSSAFSSGNCVANAVNGVYATAEQQGSPTTSGTNVTMQSSAGVFVNGSFSLICFGN